MTRESLPPTRIAAEGAKGTVEWAVDQRGRTPAADVLTDTKRVKPKDRAKILALFKRLADFWEIRNRQQFKCLGGDHGPEFSKLYEFKGHQARFLGAFRPNHRFLVSHGVVKQQDKHDPEDLRIALRILKENDQFELADDETKKKSQKGHTKGAGARP